MVDVSLPPRSITPYEVWAYSDRRLSVIIASNNLRVSNDTLRYTNSTSYTKLKESMVFLGGIWRVYFEMYVSGGTGYAQIYRNDTPYGTARSTTSTTAVAFTEDLVFAFGDKVQIYAYATSGYYTYVQNLRLMGDISDQIVYGSATKM